MSEDPAIEHIEYDLVVQNRYEESIGWHRD